MNIDKIGMFKTDEILEFMTEGEGRGFLGRSMFDAMYFEIKRLNNIINELENELISLYKKPIEDEYDKPFRDGIETIIDYLKELKEKE